MNALILAAGVGKRLHPLTSDTPKPLLKVRNRPILGYILDSLSLVEVNEIFIVVGWQAAKIKDHFRHETVKFIYNDRFRDRNNIYSILAAKDFLDEKTILINSDVIFHPEILSDLVKNKDGITLAVDIREDLSEEDMKVIVRGDKVKRISKEIPLTIADGEYIGIAMVNEPKMFLDIVAETTMRKGYGVFYEDAIQKIIENSGRVYYEPVKRPWIEIDDFHDLAAAETLVSGLDVF